MKNSNQSWKEVIGHFMYFLYTVLPGAASHTLWTKEGVDRALSWAQYCERTVTLLRHRGSLQKALAVQVRQSQHIANFRDLLKARHILLKLLLQNQLLENNVREHILTVSQKAHGVDFIKHAEFTVQQQQQHAKALLTLLTKAHHSSTDLRVRVRLMMEAAHNKDPEQVGLCLAKVAHSPASLQAGIKAALLEGEDVALKVGPAVVQWVRGVVTSPEHRQYKRVLGCLCSLAPHHLSKALTSHPQLVMSILDCVHREALNLEPCYARGECRWRPCGPSVLNWEDLVRTYTVLSSHKKMGAHVEEAVEGWRMLEGGAVWGDIVKQTKACSISLTHTTSYMKT